MAKAVLKKEKWTLSFDSSLKDAVIKEKQGGRRLSCQHP